ncbi:MAG: aminotransferase class III-fold pyridoxal phosphate-dependent enzyme, partial [Desulfitobacteriaceae bacterium]
VLEQSAYFKSGMEALAEKYQTGGTIRGQGMILGWPVSKLGSEIVEACRAQGLLINCVGGLTLRFLPPLNVQETEIDQALEILDQVFAQVWNL